jgi:phosphate transport system permease protein
MMSTTLGHSPGARRRKIKSRFFEGLCALASLIAVSVLFAILAYIFIKGFRALNWDFFTKTPAPVGETGGGVSNAIIGTLIIVAGAGLIAIPIGIAAGTYLAEFGRGRFAALVRLLADVLTGVPSIVIGILAYELVVVNMHHFSGVAGSIALSAIMLPPIIRTTEEILRLVPREYTEAGLALGAPKWRTIMTVVFPAAIGGLTTGVMLALARASGETAPLLFTAFGNTYWSTNPRQPMSALPLQIYQYAISPYDDWHSQAWAAALVLVTMVLIFSALARIATRKSQPAR